MRIQVSADSAFLSQLPDSPGVYRYYSSSNELLYVGKAISLLKRVKSYFQKRADLSPRISLMVTKIAEIEVTLTENETSALLLENNLIKSLKPKYNIIFRDDKSYPYIRVTAHAFPLIEYFRGKPEGSAKPRQPGSLAYFGPYSNSTAVRETLELLQRLFKLRTCSNGVFANRSRPCMLHQINLCSAPCVAAISPVEYATNVQLAKDFLSGNYTQLISQLSSEMYAHAERLDFELAGALRDKITLIKQLQDRQIISDSNLPINADIVLCEEFDNQFLIYLILVRNGLYVGDKHFVVAKQDSRQLILEAFLERYYAGEQIERLIYLEEELSVEVRDYFQRIYSCRLCFSLRGRIRDLASMGHANMHKLLENSRIATIYSAGADKLAKLLGLPKISRIECYDTSHNQGKSAIASLVVYAGGKIDHGLYRKYNLPDTVNGDDLLALQQVLRRRLANSELELPQVILVDGGHNQLKLAKNLISELGFCAKIRIIAIFKGEDRKPELDKIIVDALNVLNFRQEPQVFRLLQALRDEAHRFAITGHRKKQADRMKLSRLEDIPGIGVQKRKKLIAFFGSSQEVAAASVAQLQHVDGIGFELATQIYNFFNA